MELRHLRYFVAVADHLHFGRAAHDLHVAQPALSRQIMDLEEEVGTRLLSRTNRRVELTPAGQVFLTDVREVLARADRARQRVKQVARGELGRLVMGYVLSATGRVLTNALLDFQRRFPEVEIELQDHGEVEQWRLLIDGELDLAFTRTPLEHERIARLAIQRQRMVVLLPLQHALAGSASVPLARLANEQWIIGQTADFPSYNSFLTAQCRRAGFEPRIRQQVRDLASIVWMVSAGMGVGFAQTGTEELMRPGLVARPLTPQITSCVWMHWRQDDPSQALARFLECVRTARE